MSETRKMPDGRDSGATGGPTPAVPLETFVSPDIEARARASSTDTLVSPDIDAQARIFSASTLVSVDIEEQARASSAESLGGLPTIPGFTFDDRLGTGAFGEVWSATQLSTGQKVAVKILHRCSDSHLLAMQREVTRLASVAEHPNVLTVHDASFTHRPPYLVTPLLATSLDRFVGETSPEQAAAWLEQMARALQYAHGRGIIHCDLKPANILLDERKTVRIVDWGQAQIAGRSGASMGTLWFMPPEQAVIPRGEQEVVPDVTWDVYALGATVYQILTMRQPRASEAAETAISSEVGLRILDIYRERMQGTPLTPIRQLNPKVPVDLACIVEHCLALDPRARYQSMGEIVDDLKRMREKRPLNAHPRTLPYVFSCFVRRNAVPVGLSVVFLATLATTGGISVQRVVTARNAAVQASAEAIVARNDAVSSLAAFEHKTGLDLKDDPVATLWLSWAAWHQPDSLEYTSTALWQLEHTAPLAAAFQMCDARPVFPHQEFGTLFNPQGTIAAFSGLEGNVRLWNVGSGQTNLLQHGMFIKTLFFSPDGTRLYTGCHDGLIRVWDPRNGGLLQTFQGGPFLALSPDGKQLAGGFKNELHRWNAADGTRLEPDIALEGNMARLAHSGRFILTSGLDAHAIEVFDAASGAKARTLKTPELVVSLAVSPDGTYVAAGCFDGTIVAFSVADGREIARTQLADSSGFNKVDVSADGRMVAVDLAGHVRLVSGKTEVDVDAPGANSVRFSPDGKRFVVTSREGPVRVFDAASGQSALPPFRHAGSSVSAAFSADGHKLVSQGDDGQARLWDLEKMETSGTLGWSAQPPQGRIHVAQRPNNEGAKPPSASFSPDGKLVVLSWGKELSFRDAVTGKPLAAPVKLPVELHGLVVRDDGKSVVAVGADLRARILAIPSGEVMSELTLTGKEMTFGHKGTWIASADSEGRITVFDVNTCKPVGRIIESKLDVRELRMSHDGSLLLVQTKDMAYQIFDVEKATPLTERVAVPGGAGAIHFIENGKRLAMQDARGSVWLVDAQTGKALTGMMGGQGLPGAFTFRPDGKLMAVSQQDRVVRFYDPATGAETGTPLPVHDVTGIVMFIGDGKRMLTAGMDHGVRLWDVETATPLSPSILEGEIIWRVLVDHDCTRMLTITASGYRVWPLTTLRRMERDELTQAAREKTGLTLDAKGEVYTAPISKTVR